LGNLPAVEVKQNAKPAKHDVAIVPSDPARGKDSNNPIAVGGGVKLNSIHT
jgi:hypothetical protein